MTDKPANPFPNLGEGQPDWREQTGPLEKERGTGLNKERFYSICSKHFEPDPNCNLCRTGSWENETKAVLGRAVYKACPGLWMCIVNKHHSLRQRLAMIFKKRIR